MLFSTSSRDSRRGGRCEVSVRDDSSALPLPEWRPHDTSRTNPAHALAAENVAASESPRAVSQTCRHFGISRQAFYKWKKRHEKHGDAGLCDRPRAPIRSPSATSPGVVGKILYLRQNYHFGPRKIADYLKREMPSHTRSSVRMEHSGP